MSAIAKKGTLTVQHKSKINNYSKNLYMYILLLPAVLSTFIFYYLPLGGILIAFKDYDVLAGFGNSPWVGLKNFTAIFQLPKFLQAIGNTFLYSSVIIFGSFLFPIILALLFNELKNAKFKKLVQTVSYLPYFLSWISVIGIFHSIFSLNGMFNDVMVKIFGNSYERVNILLNEKYFLGILFTSHVWKNIGWSSVIYLAAIAGIDPVMYEAAIIDGCGKFKQVLYITIPSIMGTMIIILVLSLGNLVTTNFEQVYGLQNVFTQEATEVINTLIYRQGIQNGQYSIATAFGLVQGVVSVSLIFMSNLISKKLFSISIW